MEKLWGGLYLKTWTRMNAFKDGRRTYLFRRVSGGKSSWRPKRQHQTIQTRCFLAATGSDVSGKISFS